MSVINVTVTNAGAASVAVSGGSTVNATVGNGGAVNVSTGTISPGNATVVSGTLAINSVTTLAAGSQAYVKNDIGTAFAAKLDIGIPAGPATSVTVAKTTTLAAGSSATVTGVTDGGSLALSFGIPAGADGTNGTDGVTPTITATATTLSAGSSATVTATPSDGGSKVALAFGIPRGADGAAGAGGGATLSDSTPSALGTASAGVSTTASRSDHVHAVPVISYANLSNVPSTFAPSTHTHTASQVTDFTAAAAAAAPVQTVAGRTGDVVISTSDVEGLSESLANVSVDVIDGGDYVGVVVEPTPSITITAQPANRSVSTSAANEVSSTLPSGTWGPISRVNSQWITSGYQSTQADYLAVSTDGASWTKRYGLPSAGNWSAVQYQNGVYATQAGNVVAYSSDATTWSSATFTNSRGSVFGAGGKFLRATRTGIFASTDAATWTQTASNTSSSQSISFAYENNTYFAVEQNQAIRASADGLTWALIADNFYNAAVSSAVTFASGVHLGFNQTWPIRYAGGTIANGAGTLGSTGGQFATNGSVLVFFAHTGKLFSSTNGTSFVERTLPTTLSTGGQIARLFYSGGTFALVMQYGLSGGATTTDPGTVFFTSTNGVDWTQSTRTYPTYVTTGGSYVANGYLASHNGSAWSYLQIGSSTAVAAFSVSAFFSGNTLTYQWQASTDAGTTWANVSGATSATLSLSGLTTADNGKRYRCILSATGVASVTTNSATLTVT
jgi:hypothetical protein